MHKVIFQLIISALIAVHVFGQGVIPPEPPNNGTTPPVPPTPEPTTSTTISPTPTTKPTTPRPEPPPTTKPTPTPKPPPTPEPSPTPEPTPTPPTTPAPLPPKPVEPSKGKWNVTDAKTKLLCIQIEFALQVEIPYFHISQNKIVNATVDLPDTAIVSRGECNGKDDEDIEIQWVTKDNKTDFITFNFAQIDNPKTYILTNIGLSITPDDSAFPGINNKTTILLNHNYQEFNTSLFRSYKCEKKQTLNLTDDSNKPRGVIYIKQLQFQAFGNTTDNSFYTAENCESSDTPDVVPIAVGCALALLVIAVLVAYLIGRKRRQARGYLSMFTETKRESDYIPMKNLSCFQ